MYGIYANNLAVVNVQAKDAIFVYCGMYFSNYNPTHFTVRVRLT